MFKMAEPENSWTNGAEARVPLYMSTERNGTFILQYTYKIYTQACKGFMYTQSI